jgi:hypothetical protein
MTEPIFARDGEAWAPTEHARGPWDPDMLHGGAPAALLARELERLEPGSEMFMARVTYDYLGPVPLATLEAAASTEKPGARLQVVTGELRAAGAERVALRARGVRLRRADAKAVGEGPPLPPPDTGHDITPFGSVTDAGFHPTGVEMRLVEGGRETGAAKAWFRLLRPVVAGEEPTPLQRVVAAADFGNGISSAYPFDEYLFANCDLSVHLHREPEGEWIGLDARTIVGPQGVAQATSVLHDGHGPVGYAAQTLFVERR